MDLLEKVNTAQKSQLDKRISVSKTDIENQIMKFFVKERLPLDIYSRTWSYVCHLAHSIEGSCICHCLRKF